MAIVFSYLRFSKPEQLKGDSQRRQVEMTQRWVEVEGHILDKSLDLRDLGVSAFRGKNAEKYGTGQLGLFLECIESGRVPPGSILAIENLDRISRQKLNNGLMLFQKIVSSGVSIKTFVPDELITPEDLDNPFKMMMVLTILYRAHEESAMKSSRLKASWKNRRDKKVKLGRTPAWVDVERTTNGVIYRVNKEKVDVVKRIFQLCLDGVGSTAIAKKLNQDSVPTLRYARRWTNSTIISLLRNRTVLGEYQPCIMDDGRRIPIGDPFLDYYPRIISDEIFYSAQNELDSRKLSGGRYSQRVINLFTGLVYDARDGSKMHINSSGGPSAPKSIVSSDASYGRGLFISFPYKQFEQSLLVFGWNLQLSDVLPKKAQNLSEKLSLLEGKLSETKKKIKMVNDRFREEGAESFLDLLTQLGEDKIQQEEEINRLKVQMSSGEIDALTRTQELIKKAMQDDTDTIRIKLRATLRRLIEDIVVLIVQVDNIKVAIVSTRLKSGYTQQFEISAEGDVEFPKELIGMNVREWSKWPKKLKKKKFSVRAYKMLAMEKQGFTRAEIAEKFQCSRAQVSKLLISIGERKGPQRGGVEPE